MNCILYTDLVTKYNQISQNVYTTAHCPITLGPLPHKAASLLLLTYREVGFVNPPGKIRNCLSL